ncbi:MAG: hypothetical protein KF899_04330 [Parvibaculum sp.]|nr:hypothetical protein [Parvibaculum sp.]
MLDDEFLNGLPVVDIWRDVIQYEKGTGVGFDKRWKKSWDSLIRENPDRDDREFS